MGLSDYQSPDRIREYQNLNVSVIPKMNCENHLIHLQIDQFTVVLTMSNAKRLAFILQQTIDEIDDEVDNRALSWLKDYTEIG